MSGNRQTTAISSDINETYRPRSPDLSAYVLQQQQQQSHLSQPSQDFSSPPSTKRSSFHQQPQSRTPSSAALTGLPSSLPPSTHRGSYDASPYFNPQGSDSGYRVQQGVQRGSISGYGGAGGVTQSPIGTNFRLGPGVQTLEQQEVQPQGPGLDQQPFTQSPLVFQPSSFVNPQSYPLEHTMPPMRRRQDQLNDNHDNGISEHNPEFSATPGGRSTAKGSKKRMSGDNQQEWTVGRAPGEVGPSLGIDVRTKFPVARIKRIMQADEDVGKVAQVAPTALSKALELFMITLVTKAAAEAKDRSSKRVTAAHLKQAVIKDQTFDFLQEIIDKVADPTEKKSGDGAGSEDVDDGAGGGPAKRKRAIRGRKTAGSDED